MYKLLIAICLAAMSSYTLADCSKAAVDSSDFPDSLSTVNTAEPGDIRSTWYDGATDRYAHGVLGDAIEPSILVISHDSGCTTSVELDSDHVFEDIAPRLANIDNVKGAEVITIRSHKNYGAQIAVYQLAASNKLQLLATTPYIGTSNRWLAPIGIADFNNDNDMDIAFVDRPHLAKVLRVWTYRDGKLEQIAHKSGYSNHRIGEDFISGGIKSCNGTVTMITADARWQRIMETSLVDGRLLGNDIGAFENTDSLRLAMECQ